jgi:hypothetical protein
MEILVANMRHGDIGDYSIPDLLLRGGIILSHDINSNAGGNI